MHWNDLHDTECTEIHLKHNLSYCELQQYFYVMHVVFQWSHLVFLFYWVYMILLESELETARGFMIVKFCWNTPGFLLKMLFFHVPCVRPLFFRISRLCLLKEVCIKKPLPGHTNTEEMCWSLIISWMLCM